MLEVTDRPGRMLTGLLQRSTVVPIKLNMRLSRERSASAKLRFRAKVRSVISGRNLVAAPGMANAEFGHGSTSETTAARLGLVAGPLLGAGRK